MVPRRLSRCGVAFVRKVFSSLYRLVIYGLMNQFVNGKLGLYICLVCLYVGGIGVRVFIRYEVRKFLDQTYITSSLHTRSADAAMNNRFDVSATNAMLDWRASGSPLTLNNDNAD